MNQINYNNILQEKMSFVCNICGSPAESKLCELGRETPSCATCGSTLRFRTIVYVLSKEILGKSLAIPDFPERPDVKGMGMSDVPLYAMPLAKKFNYINTYYHQEPKLDITSPPPDVIGTLDFLISSDVFEHVPSPVSLAFENAEKLLKPGGVFIFSAPYSKEGEGKENFPDLFDYEIVEEEGRTYLRNTTRDGEVQIIDNLVFHGGGGSTLELRVFSEASILKEFKQAGFDTVKIYNDNVASYGICWEQNSSLVMSARKRK